MSATRIDRVVVVGNGIAGLTAADTLRDLGFAGELTLVGAEAHAPYSRPALSKALLAAAGEVTAHVLPPPDHGGLELRGRVATRLDIDRRRVRLDDGAELPYDGLVIASGSRARRLGRSRREVVLRSLDDALALRAALSRRPRVVVIGSGPLAMEVASSAVDAGCPVAVVVRTPPMQNHVGTYLSALLERAAGDAGVVAHRSAGLRVTDRPDGAVVVLDDDTALEAELLVTAVGDEPEVGWLAGTGLLQDGMLRADSRGRVGDGIVCAGDVAAFPTTRGMRRMPLWTNAIESAKVAATALLHGDDASELGYVPYFWTDQFGIRLRVCGELPVAGDPRVHDGSMLDRRAVLRWEHADGTGTAAAVNLRVPIPRLRALVGSPVAA